MTRQPRRRAPLTLRRKLVITVVTMVAIVSAVVGIASVTVLRDNLTDQVDTELDQAVGRAAQTLTGAFPQRDGYFGINTGDYTEAELILGTPGQSPNSLAVVSTASGGISAGYINNGSVTELSTDQLSSLVQSVTSEAPFTIDLGSELGVYRVQAKQNYAGVVAIGVPMSDVDASVSQLTTTILIAALIGIIVIAIIAAAFIRSTLRPLERVAGTARRVSQLPLDRGEVALRERVSEVDTDPRTEVGQVVSAFNRMLSHVGGALEARQDSENKVRRFVADASHELRTPLASIRGYSELTRRMSDELPEDAVYALGRIESESIRMTSLVEDLLLLARLDEGKELLSQEVDLSRLVVDSTSDAQAAGPDHVWQASVPDTEVVVSGDGAKLHQVLLNLLANARTHTPAGSTVTVSLSREQGPEGAPQAVIRVADNGPGIPAESQAVIFERFTRADESRARTTGSTGLGLAIVSAIVGGHHGSVEVRSVPGDTVFTVRLPLSA